MTRPSPAQRREAALSGDRLRAHYADRGARANGAPGSAVWWDVIRARAYGSRWATRDRVLRHLRERPALP